MDDPVVSWSVDTWFDFLGALEVHVSEQIGEDWLSCNIGPFWPTCAPHGLDYGIGGTEGRNITTGTVGPANSIADLGVLNFSTANAFSISIHLRRNDSSVAVGKKGIVSFAGSYFLGVTTFSAGADSFCFELTGVTGETSCSSAGAGDWVADEWTHLLFVWDGNPIDPYEDGVATIYQDGVEIRSETLDGLLTDPGGVTYIGTYASGQNSGFAFDNPIFFDVALTEADANELKNCIVEDVNSS